MLMSVQFPGHLGIADHGKIEVLHTKGQLARGLPAVNLVQMPIDLFAVVETLKAQQIEAVFQDVPGALNDVFRLFWQPLAEKRHELWNSFGFEKESSLQAGRRSAQVCAPFMARFEQRRIPSSSHGLA